MRATVVLVLAAALGACGASPTENDLAIEPISIDGVDVTILKSLPPQASAHVTGVIGDGCSELHSVTQSRSGNTVTIRILRQRPREAVCIQIARLYDEVIRLTGTFPAGRYVVDVNGVTREFTTS